MTPERNQNNVMNVTNVEAEAFKLLLSHIIDMKVNIIRSC